MSGETFQGLTLTQTRKTEHLRICLEREVERGDPLFDEVTLVHQALPENDLEEMDTSCSFLGKQLAFPLLIAAITGGCEEAKEINRSLARVAEKKGIAFGVGSQRAMIEKPELAETFMVRAEAPGILLLGNIGLTALKQVPADRVLGAAEAIGADALCVHLNPAQEIFQAEGDQDFSGCLQALTTLCAEAPLPVIAKEVGNGISREAARRLKKAGVGAIDVGGVGGTSWVLIDGLRADTETDRFEAWGIPTAAAILEARVGLPLIATGGVRNGLQMAKAIALGADLCGIALPFLKALARGGIPAVEDYVALLKREFKAAMFLTGCKNIEELKRTDYILGTRLKEWVEQRGLRA